jgi:regulator of replication initiation timing
MVCNPDYRQIFRIGVNLLASTALGSVAMLSSSNPYIGLHATAVVAMGISFFNNKRSTNTGELLQHARSEINTQFTYLESQIELLSREVTALKEELGKDVLDEFEQAVLQNLQDRLDRRQIFQQFDVSRGKYSKTLDFLVVMDNCAIALEVKNYQGEIESTGSDSLNAAWSSRFSNGDIPIQACWGVNPYQQIKTYTFSLLSRVRSPRTRKTSVYGIVVFPSGSTISPRITAALPAYYRVTTLDRLQETLLDCELEARAQRDGKPSTWQHLRQTITDYSPHSNKLAS